MDETPVLSLDLDTSFEVFASTLGMTLRNRKESRLVTITPSSIFVVCNKDSQKDQFNVIFKLPELKKNYADNIVEIVRKSNDASQFSTLYAYFGHILGLYTFLSLFNTKNVPDMREYKTDVKIILKQLIRAMKIAEEKGIYFKSFIDQELESDKEKDDDFSNELKIAFNFDSMIDMMDDYLGFPDTYIPTQRILSLTYVAMYYVLIGTLPSMFNSNLISFRQFLEICRKKNGALDAIKNILNNYDPIPVKRILGLINTFYRMSEFYAIHCPVFTIDDNKFTNKNLTFLALNGLGEAIEKIPDDEEFSHWSELYKELLNNNAFGVEISLEQIMDTSTYFSPMHRITLNEDITSASIIGYDLGEIIDINIRNDGFTIGHKYSNPLFITSIKLDNSKFFDSMPLKEIEDFIINELGNVQNGLVSPETMERLTYFAAMSRMIILSKKELPEDLMNLVHSILYHAEALLVGYYTEWFIKKDRIYKNVKRYMVSEIESNNKYTLLQLKSECDFILLNYCDFVSTAYIYFKKEEEDKQLIQLCKDCRSNQDLIYNSSILLMQRSRTHILNKLEYIKLIDNVTLSIENMANDIINLRYTLIIQLFSLKLNDNDYIMQNIFITMMNGRKNDYIDFEQLKNFLNGLSSDREGVCSTKLYRKIVSNFVKIYQSNLTNTEKFILLYHFVIFFTFRNLASRDYIEENDMNNILLLDDGDDANNQTLDYNQSIEDFIAEMYPRKIKQKERGFYEQLLGRIK